MKVHYDHQAFTIQEYGGISRYFYELLTQLHDYPHMEISNSLVFSNNEYIKGNDLLKAIAFFKGINLQKKIEAMIALNEFNSLRAYKREEFDLFHPTYYDTYYLKFKSKKPVVITFHDLIHEKFKQHDQVTLSNKRKVLHRADHIIAVSQSSKNDMVQHFGIPEDRVTVIHLASSILSPVTGSLPTISDNYILYVGGRNEYKNFSFFVSAIAPLLLKDPSIFLYCSGGGKFSKEEQLHFQELKVSHKVRFFPGSDENLTTLYSNALAFFFPSIYEGFGLPLLEAMNCGCPVAASNTSSLPEVCGDAAMYFSPYDQESVLSVAETLVACSHVRETLRQKGFLRAKEFSWQKTAAMTHNLYKTLV
jgi:glycosyltransferase involved in cell wall biosynthesis